MSHLLAPQEEKRDTRTTQSDSALGDTSFLVPPQEEKSGNSSKNVSGQTWMVPPQEEKVDVAGLRGEQSRLDQALNRLEDKVNQRHIERDTPRNVDDIARDKQQRDSVLSGSAGITGEDVGVAEKSRLV
ncbi:hypothetical protein BD413DRAFT_501568 [Trametes elegans]|nr:hypothetical protein BD413DRAFT_501568 [Trametes elegans]